MRVPIYVRPEKAKNPELLKLERLHKRAVNVLFQCHGVFPFDFFPNILSIDYNKVDIVYRDFYRNERIISIPIENVNYIIVESGAMFATLKIEVKGMAQDPEPLDHLWRKDAVIAQKLIFGLMAADKFKIDLSDLPKEDILDKLIEIGHVV
jgi:hypothetical protein